MTQLGHDGFAAADAIIIGVLQLYAATQLQKVIDNEWWPILSGLLSIAFGAVLIAWPGTGALLSLDDEAFYGNRRTLGTHRLDFRHSHPHIPVRT